MSGVIMKGGPTYVGSYMREQALENRVKELEAKLAALREWLPMETAPKDGTPILGWRVDAGVMLIKWTAPDYFLPSEEAEQLPSEFSEQEDWFSSDLMGWYRLDGDLVPSHWMPLPPPPTNGKG